MYSSRHSGLLSMPQGVGGGGGNLLCIYLCCRHGRSLLMTFPSFMETARGKQGDAMGGGYRQERYPLPRVIWRASGLGCLRLEMKGVVDAVGYRWCCCTCCCVQCTKRWHPERLGRGVCAAFWRQYTGDRLSFFPLCLYHIIGQLLRLFLGSGISQGGHRSEEKTRQFEHISSACTDKKQRGAHQRLVMAAPCVVGLLQHIALLQQIAKT